jgi:hypothetical protein
VRKQERFQITVMKSERSNTGRDLPGIGGWDYPETVKTCQCGNTVLFGIHPVGAAVKLPPQHVLRSHASRPLGV